MALIPSLFFDAVVAIGFPSNNDQIRYAATGFLYGQPIRQSEDSDNKYRVFLLTNRHVFGNRDVAKIRFNVIGGELAKDYTLTLKGQFGRSLWCPHPDQNIDLAIACLDVRKLRNEGVRFSYFREDKDVYDSYVRGTDGVTEGDGVFILGFPMGDVGVNENFVLVRHGTIARVRNTLKGQSKDFVLDTFIFPGNSGSPVVTRPEIVASEGLASQGCYLLGIVKSYTAYKNVAINIQTREPSLEFEQHSGLAQAHLVDVFKEAIKFSNDRVNLLPDPTCTHDIWR